MKQRSEQSTSSGNRPMTGKSEVKQEKMTFLRRPARKYALLLENYLPLVRVSNISKHFGEGGARLDALREVSIDVHPGEVVALLDPSRSGKTTLLNIIGFPSSGSMELDGERVIEDGH